MPTVGDGAILRIHIDYNDVFEERPLADALILKAQELRLAVAVAIEGIVSYSRAPMVHSVELVLARDRPVAVEIVDAREKLDVYVAAVEPMLRSALATVEPATILHFGATTTG